MNAKSLTKIVVLVVVSIGVCADFAWADKQQLQEKLGKDIRIKLDDVTIAEALEKIGQKAELKIVLSDEAVWKLPHGTATRLSVTLNGPLAESLTEMLNAFLMRYAVGEEEVTIYPRPELEHILGRPMTKQLEVLRKIYTLQFNCNESGGESTYMAEFINERFGPEGLTVLPTEYYGQFVQALEPAGETPFTLAQLLDSTSHRGAWYLWQRDFANQAPEVRVVSENDFWEAKLNQIVDISFKDESAFIVLQRLANWAGVKLFVYKRSPSWLEEKVSVDMQNVKLQQAISSIVSMTGGTISIDYEDGEIGVEGPVYEEKVIEKPETSKSPIEAGGSYVGKISIPMDGGKYYIEFMLRESDLTEKLKKLRTDKMKKILEQFSRSGLGS